MDATHEVHIKLLGGFQVIVGTRTVQESEWRLRKTKNLIKLLALAPAHRLHREQLMEILWPDQDPDAAANNLKKAVHTARRALQPDSSPPAQSSFLHLQEGLLVLRPLGNMSIDVEQFERAAVEARQGTEPHMYQTALQLYAGELLPEDRYEDWAVARREELQALYLTLLMELARLLENRSDQEGAVEALRQAVADDPANEDAHVALMRLYARIGHRHRALRQYQHLREALRRDLDVEPVIATQQLYEDILAGRYEPDEDHRRHGSFSRPIPGASPIGSERAAVTLIGRDPQLEILEERLDGLFAGQGGLVLLAGEAGIGKSTMVAELAERVRHRGGIALLGAAYDQEGQLPYGPFVEALQTVGSGIALGGVRAIFADAIGDMARLTPGLTSAMQADRLRLFAAVADLLRDLSTGSPLLLALDDLHAADETSLQLMHYLARATRDRPVLLIGTFRPEDAPSTSPLGQLAGALHREYRLVPLHLGRLDSRESELLVVTLLGDNHIDHAVVEAVYRLADGNPLYTEEVVRVLQESGRLLQIDGRWRLAGEDVPLQSPILDLLAGRMQRLGSAAIQVLNVAAVVGREASYPLLRAACDLPDGVMLDALDTCLEHHALEETPEGYRFSHPLKRETIYSRLSSARRMGLHSRVATALEDLNAGNLHDQTEALAYHWTMSDQRGRAVPYLIEAGDRAAALFAHEVAISSYKEALDLLDAPGMSEHRPTTRGRVWEKIGDLWSLEGDTSRAEEAYGSAIGAVQGVPAADDVWLARLHRKAAYAALTRHDVAGAASYLFDAESILSAGTDSPEWNRVRLVRALWLWEQGNHAEGRVAAEESLALARQHDNGLDLINAYMTLALVFHSSGEWKEGLQLEIQHVGMAADVNPHLGLLFDAHMCLGEYHLYGDTTFDAVEAYARHTLELTTRIGARRAEGLAWLLLGESLLLRGHWNEAESCLNRSLDLQRAVGSVAGQAFTLQRMAELNVYRGDHEAAERYLQEALALEVDPPMAPHVLGRTYATAALNSLESGEPKAAAWILDEAGSIARRRGDCATCSASIHPVATRTYIALGDIARAEHHAEEAQRVAAHWESETWQAMAVMARAFVLQVRGDFAGAFRCFKAAGEAFERIGQRFDAARCFLWAGEIPGVWSEETRELVEHALVIFREVGAVSAEQHAQEQLALL